jgi:hypothetical protein
MIHRLHHLRGQKQEQAWLSWTVPTHRFHYYQRRGQHPILPALILPEREQQPAPRAMAHDPASAQPRGAARPRDELAGRSWRGEDRQPRSEPNGPAAIQTAQGGKLPMARCPVVSTPDGAFARTA